MADLVTDRLSQVEVGMDNTPDFEGRVIIDHETGKYSVGNLSIPSGNEETEDAVVKGEISLDFSDDISQQRGNSVKDQIDKLYGGVHHDVRVHMKKDEKSSGNVWLFELNPIKDQLAPIMFRAESKTDFPKNYLEGLFKNENGKPLDSFNDLPADFSETSIKDRPPFRMILTNIKAIPNQL